MSRWLGWVILPLAWAIACGGRYQSGAEDGETGGTSAVGASSGRGGSGASPSGATSTGGLPVGGVTGVSGTTGAVGGAGGACSCPPLTCPPGSLVVPRPDGCCLQCEVDYASCDQQREDYEWFREATLRKYKPKCSIDANCRIYYDQNQCQVPTCGVIMDAVSESAVETELRNFAAATCNLGCPPPLLAEPCLPPSPPKCFRGYCE